MKALTKRVRKSLMKRWLRSRRCPFVVWRYRGACLLLSRDQPKESKLVLRGEYDRRQLDSMSTWVAEREATALVDVGANIGLYSVIIGRAPSLSAVYAFEPIERLRHQLQMNATMNSVRTMRAFSEAVSDVQGTTSFVQLEADLGLSRIGHETMADEGKDANRVSVQTARLDDLLHHSGEAIAIKIDVEGHEVNVIRGMIRLLTENDCYLQIEVLSEHSGNLDAIASLIEPLGYRLQERIDKDHIFVKISQNAS